MRQFRVSPRYHQKRLDSFLFDMLPNVGASVIYKAFRKRSVRVNDKRVRESFLLTSGDEVEVYIPDEYLTEETGPDSTAPGNSSPLPSIIYEDDFLLIVSKPQGIPVHEDKNADDLVLDQWVRETVRKRDGDIVYEDGFPSLCHRIDRNTGGLVVLAKDPRTLAVLEDKFRNHEIKKTYQCWVNGIPDEPVRELTGYLKKDPAKSRVYLYDKPVKGSEPVITRYRILKTSGPFSLLEVELVTGKTHQIRAHLAYIGHPLLGDGKYGVNSVNRKLKLKWQALWAVRIRFEFSSPSGHLAYLSGRQTELDHIPWEEGLKNLPRSGTF